MNGRTKPVTILSVKRRHIPALTDEAIAGMGLAGILTEEVFAALEAQPCHKYIQYFEQKILAFYEGKYTVAVA